MVAAILATPGKADTGAVDPYLTAYLFSGAVAVVAAMVGVGLLRHVPADADEGADGTNDDWSRRSLVKAMMAPPSAKHD
jgi:hypothetical protein